MLVILVTKEVERMSSQFPEPEWTRRVGTIMAIDYTPGSGMATLVMLDGSLAHISSGIGMRSLEAAFGDEENGQPSPYDAIGHTISYTVDQFGIMQGFSDQPELGMIEN
jgi:hypothetical protein